MINNFKFKLTKANVVFLSLIALLAIFALWDGIQINTIYELTDINKWEVYNEFAPMAFIVAVLLTFAVVGGIVYFLTKDKGLGAGAFAAGSVMFMFGLEDCLFFLLGKQEMTACMAWFDTSGHLVGKVTQLLGQDCTSPTTLIISSLIGIVIAYKAFEYIRKKY